MLFSQFTCVKKDLHCYEAPIYKIYSVKGSELKAQEFLEFIQEDRESFIADASASLDDLHLDQDTKVTVISFPYKTN